MFHPEEKNQRKEYTEKMKMLKFIRMAAIALAVSATLTAVAKSDDDDDYDYETMSFELDSSDFPETYGDYEILTEYLPSGIDVEWTGKKLKTPKAGKPKVKKEDGEYYITVNEKGEDNPCGLKLKYKKKTGKVTGSFKVYGSYENSKGKLKLKSFSAKVSGYLYDDDGLTVTVKKLGSYSATLE